LRSRMEGSTGDVKRAAEIDGDHHVPELGSQALERAILDVRAGGVDEDVDAAVFGENLLRQFLHIRHAGSVGGDGLNRRELLPQRVQAILAARRGDDVGAFTGEQGGGGAADSAGGADDEHNLVFHGYRHRKPVGYRYWTLALRVIVKSRLLAG